LNRNLTFAPAREIEGGSRATVPADCRRIATLLGTNPDALERAMCTRTNNINGEVTVIPLPPEKAVDQRDALAKFVYGKIFDEVVHRVNQSLYRGKPGNNIGVLDIFGFEVFLQNSFEQLCINYCNERLQTFFNEIIFEGEMKMYSSEGLPCDDISFQVNIYLFIYLFFALK
jgi:myosin heavy subunit